MPTPTPMFNTRCHSFFLLIMSVTFLLTACQKDVLQESSIEQSTTEIQPLDEVELRQLVLEQVFGIPTTKMEHPQIQQMATTFLESLSTEERQALPNKIQVAKIANKQQSSVARSGATPTEQTISSGTATGQFGQSLTDQGDYLFVGDNGAVHIYHQSNGKYTEQQVISGNGTDGFGYQVAITRNWLAVGAPFENDMAGAIYIYARDGDKWSFSQKIAGESMTLLGIRFAMHGNNLVAQKQKGISGNLQVYELEDSHWKEEIILGEGLFFWDIAMDGNRIAGNGGTGLFDPAVHVYAEIDDQWTTEAVLRTPGTLLFRAVALQGQTIMANFLFPMDRSYVFTNKNGTWEADGALEMPGLIPFTNTNWIALKGNLAVVTLADDDINDAVHIYEKSFRKWRHVEALAPSTDLVNGQRIGDAVLITNRGKVVLGAPGISNLGCFCSPDSEAVLGLPGQVVIY